MWLVSMSEFKKGNVEPRRWYMLHCAPFWLVLLDCTIFD